MKPETRDLPYQCSVKEWGPNWWLELFSANAAITFNIWVVFQEIFVVFQKISLAYLEFSSEAFWLSHIVDGQVVAFYCHVCIPLNQCTAFNTFSRKPNLKEGSVLRSHSLETQLSWMSSFRTAGGKISKYQAGSRVWYPACTSLIFTAGQIYEKAVTAFLGGTGRFHLFLICSQY